MDIFHENFIIDPIRNLKEAFDFFGMKSDKDYL